MCLHCYHEAHSLAYLNELKIFFHYIALALITLVASGIPPTLSTYINCMLDFSSPLTYKLKNFAL